MKTFKFPNNTLKSINLPLTTLNIPLNSLNKIPRRTRLLFLITALFILLPLFYLTAKYSRPADAAWFDDSFAYRKKITIGNTGSADSDKKVLIDIDTATLTTDKMQADCDDTRFTDINGKLLKFYLDSAGGACDGASTDYYVLMNTINSGDTIIYMYYGNPQAANGGETAQFSQGTFTPTSGPTLASEETTPGPVAYWKFDDATGSTAQDWTVNNNDGTLGTGSSAPTWTEPSRCVSGNCLQFDGDNDYVQTTDSSSLDLVDGISISTWIKLTELSESSSGDQIVSKSGAYGLQIESDGDIEWFYDGTNALLTTTTPLASINKWYLVTATYNRTSAIVYVNGNQISSTAASSAITTNSNDLYIGPQSSTSPDRAIKGFMDEVKIYPYARTAAQVKADYAKASGAKGGGVLGAADTSSLSQGLVGYWKMDENTGTSVTDYSGNGNTGTMTGGTSLIDWTTGKFGSAINNYVDSNISSTDRSVTVGSNSSLDDLGPLTYSMWVYPRSLVSANRRIFGKDITLGYLQVSDNSTNDGSIGYFRVFSGTDLHAVTAASVLVTGKWQHVVMTWDGTTAASGVKFYVDGEYKANSVETNATGTITTDGAATMFIGSSSLANGRYFGGNYDEARIYNRALSPAEVRQLYSAAPGPAQYYSFEQVAGSTTVLDNTSSGNNGTMNNGLTDSDRTAGKFGSALHFDGDNDNVSGLINPGVSTKNFTFTMWVYPENNSADDLAGLIGTTSGSGSALSIKLSTRELKVLDPFFTTTLICSDTVTLNSWNYISIVGDGTNGNLYLNGRSCGSQALDGSLTFSSQKLGVYLNTHNLKGKIDEYKSYNYARSQKQIIEDMNAGHPAGGSPVGSAVAEWRLDDMQGTTAQDGSVNNNDLTLSSASWTTSGKIGGGWNGTGALWLSKTDDADFDVTATDDYSVTGWVKSDSASNPGSAEYVFDKANATTAGYAVYFNTSGFLCFGIDDDTTWGPDIASCTTTDVYDNAWHHFTAVRDVTLDKTYIYVDATLKDSDSDTTSATLENSLLLYVGDRDGTDNGNEFNGDIDDIRVYRLPLNQDDVKIVYSQNAAIVLGAKSTASDGATADNSQAREYCVPGDTTSCSGPVGEWKMDEGTGQSVYETSGNANAGTLGAGGSVASDDPTWAAGRKGGALSFDGTDDIVKVGTASTYNITGNITLSAWIKPDNSGATNPEIISKSAGALGYRMRYRSTRKMEFNLYGTSDTSLTSATSMSTSAWNHVEMVYDGSYKYIYINGVLDASEATTGSINTSAANSLYFGTTTGADELYGGKIDDVRIYDYARTPAQVAWDYNQGKPIAHWRLDECQGSTAYGTPLGAVYDSSLNGTITIGSGGSEATVGDCTTSSTSWYNGVTGKFNSSLDFDGTDDEISVPYSTSFGSIFNDKVSYSAWINFSALPGSTVWIIDKPYTSHISPFYQLSLRIQSTGVVQFLGYDSAGFAQYNTSTSALSTGQWYHIVGTIDPTAKTSYLYLNGKLVSSDTTLSSDYTNYATGIAIGGLANTTGSNFDGQIDDVQIFNYALTPLQVKSVMNEGAVRFGPSTGAP